MPLLIFLVTGGLQYNLSANLKKFSQTLPRFHCLPKSLSFCFSSFYLWFYLFLNIHKLASAESWKWVDSSGRSRGMGEVVSNSVRPRCWPKPQSCPHMSLVQVLTCRPLVLRPSAQHIFIQPMADTAFPVVNSSGWWHHLCWRYPLSLLGSFWELGEEGKGMVIMLQGALRRNRAQIKCLLLLPQVHFLYPAQLWTLSHTHNR